MSTNKLNLEELDYISGGNSAQMKELTEFIHTVQPDYEIRSESDISNWLYNNAGIGLYEVSISESDLYWNQYKRQLNGYVTHETVMEMLHKKFGV